MRDWQVGDPIGDGNDIGVPDTKYMGYLRKDNKNNKSKNSFTKDIERSKQYRDEAWKLYEEDKFYDALSFINAAIRYDSDDDRSWNIKGIILWGILETNDISVGSEAYECFNKALEIKPNDNIIKNNKIGFLLEWSVKLMWEGDNEQAMIRTNESLSIIDDKTSGYYADALALKGTIYVYTGNYDKAIEYYDNALDVNPTDENLHKMKQDLIKKGLWSPNI